MALNTVRSWMSSQCNLGMTRLSFFYSQLRQHLLDTDCSSGGQTSPVKRSFNPLTMYDLQVVYEHTFKNAYLYYRFTSDDKVPSNARKQPESLAAFPSGAVSLADLGDLAESKAKEEGDSSFKPLKLKESTDKHRVVFAGVCRRTQTDVMALP